MHTLRTIIVDDEPLSLDLLRAVLNEISDVEIIAECCNGKEAVEAATRLQPELLFLDIQMPGMNGFDYVLKPLDKERIARSIDRAVDRLKSDVDKSFKSPLIGAIEEISERASKEERTEQAESNIPDGMKRKLLVRDSGVVKVIPFDDIDWVDAAGDYMCVHAGGETHVIRSTLRDLMTKLDDNLFVRIHRSTIVNVERVVSVTPLQKGGSLLHLNQGESLKVSRNYRDSIRKFFN